MKAIVVVGLGYGDEGKGTIVDSLVRKTGAGVVVRYNGGFQAAHTVHTEDGNRHVFSQFGSGTLAGADTILGPGVIINPLSMQIEEEFLAKHGINNALSKMSVWGSCLVTTPYHKALNRVRELSRKAVHGSTGSGIGETVRLSNRDSLALRVRDFRGLGLTIKLHKIKDETYHQCVELIHDYELETNPFLADAMEPFNVVDGIDILFDRYFDWITKVKVFKKYVEDDFRGHLFDYNTPIVLEGAQGVLLDKKHGFHPYTTWSDTTNLNANGMLEENDEVLRIGVIRTFMTRHGAGPLVTEFDKGSKEMNLLNDDDNTTHQYAGSMRAGYLDLVAIKYAMNKCCTLDALALTHCDKLLRPGTEKVCTSYNGANLIEYQSTEASVEAYAFTKQLKQAIPVYEDTTDLQSLVEHRLEIPVLIASFGKTHKDKKYMGAPITDSFPDKEQAVQTKPIETPVMTLNKPETEVVGTTTSETTKQVPN